MTTIKKISGEILLYLYLIQRQDAGKLKNIMLTFGTRALPDRKSTLQLDSRSESVFKINDFDFYSDNDIYNALVYLYDSSLIEYKESRYNTGLHLINFKVTSSGINIVESIERGSGERQNFNMTFNFNIKNNVTVESLLKTKFESIFKASAL